MKNRFLSRSFLCLVLIVVLRLPAVPVSMGAEARPGSELPDSMKSRWEGVRQRLIREYEVCREHCGTNRNCLDRCEKAYNSRLDHEYRRMIHEKPGMEGATGETGPGKQVDTIEEKWGVRPLNVRLTGSDHFLDFRYRVTDSKKASAVLSRKEKAFLVHEDTGKVFPVPVTKLGPLRATAVEPKEDRNYVILFANSDKTIKKGHKVTVVIGEFRVEHLTVE